MIPNPWGISRDESVYPDPETFNLDRFLDRNVPYAYETPFEFGRGRCPGMHVVNLNLLIAFACLLAAFETTKATSDDGNMVESSVRVRKYSNRRPEQLRCGLKPRNLTLLSEVKDE